MSCPLGCPDGLRRADERSRPMPAEKDKSEDSRPSTSSGAKAAQPQAPPKPKPRQPKIVKKKDEDYMAGIGLPSSDSETDEEDRVGAVASRALARLGTPR